MFGHGICKRWWFILKNTASHQKQFSFRWEPHMGHTDTDGKSIESSTSNENLP